MQDTALLNVVGLGPPPTPPKEGSAGNRPDNIVGLGPPLTPPREGSAGYRPDKLSWFGTSPNPSEGGECRKQACSS